MTPLVAQGLPAPGEGSGDCEGDWGGTGTPGAVDSARLGMRYKPSERLRLAGQQPPGASPHFRQLEGKPGPKKPGGEVAITMAVICLGSRASLREHGDSPPRKSRLQPAGAVAPRERGDCLAPPQELEGGWALAEPRGGVAAAQALVRVSGWAFTRGFGGDVERHHSPHHPPGSTHRVPTGPGEAVPVLFVFCF